MQATFPALYPERPISSLTCQIHCHLWLSVLSPRLHFTAIAILTNSSIFFSIIVYFRKMLKNKLGTIFKTLQLLYLGLCSKVVMAANIGGLCLCTKINSTPGKLISYEKHDAV
jgi:hypothetical protein